MLEYRPVLYRAADALDRSGGAREVADSLYAELYGIKDAPGERRSLFHYFQGRSSLATWLRAVLAQRYVDRLRASGGSSRCPTSSEEAGEMDGARGGRGIGRVPDPVPMRSGRAIPRCWCAVLARAVAALQPRIGCGWRPTTCRS